mgnify:CR=1 FL=1
MLRDAKSGQPTTVNGIAVRQVSLRDGDVIQVGEARIQYRAGSFAAPAAAPAARAPAPAPEPVREPAPAETLSYEEAPAAPEPAQPVNDPATGALSFQVQNNSGHKLISGFPEGRRMFVTVTVFDDGNVVHTVNPYDATASTLKGLSSPSSPPLGPGEVHDDALVYEVKLGSSRSWK